MKSLSIVYSVEFVAYALARIILSAIGILRSLLIFAAQTERYSFSSNTFAFLICAVTFMAIVSSASEINFCRLHK